MIIPLVMLMAQLQSFFGHRGFAPNEAGLAKVRMVPDWQSRVGFDSQADPNARPLLELVAPPEIRIETAGVWAPSLREMAWRMRPIVNGDYELEIRIRREVHTKSVLASQRLAARAPVRPRSFVGQILHPTEAPLPRSSIVESIVLAYPERRLHVLGTDANWLVVYLVLTLGFGLSLRGRLGVSI